MKKYPLYLCLLLLPLNTLSACDSPFSLSSRVKENNASLQLRANLNSTQPGNPQASLEVLIPNPNALPESLRQAADLKVIVDNSNTLTTVNQESDGSLRFLVSPGVQKDSEGNIKVIFTAQAQSQAVTLLTGSLATLKSQAITVSPGSQVTQGTEITLQAQLENPEQASNLSFQWSVGTSLSGQFQPLTGNQPSVTWDEGRPGSYYVRVQLTDQTTQTQSSYTTPSPLFQIVSPDNLALLSPSSGSVFLGQDIQIQANIPEVQEGDFTYRWSFAPSLQASFQPIAEQGKTIRWEPPSPGAYFLRLNTSQGTQESEYTTSKPVVFVSTSDSLFKTDPLSGVINRGERVRLSANLPNAQENLSYQWSFGFNPQAAFTPIPGSGASIEWNPELTGDFFLRVKTVDPQTQNSQTFTSTKPLVSVQDDNSVFSFSPNPAQIFKGENINLSLKNVPSTANISWAFGSSPQGPYQNISGNGQNLKWTPTSTGSFYIQAKVTEADGSISTYQSANSLISVSEHPNPIGTDKQGPQNLNLGQSVILKSNLNASLIGGSQFSWAYGSSAQGPFTPIVALENNSASTITWYPPQTGSFFIQATMTSSNTQSPVTFVSTNPLVIVNENTPFFTSSPTLGKIKTDENIRLKTAFDNRGRNFNYGWAYSVSSSGPFVPIGGSTAPEILWDAPNKPTGSYFIRFTATPPGTSRQLTYVSQIPLVFVTQSSASSGQFGSN